MTGAPDTPVASGPEIGSAVGPAIVPETEPLEFRAEDVRRLENISTRAWPAKEHVPLDGWFLRQSPAPTRRVNSVLANDDGGALDLDARIAEAEAFYAAHSQPPRFQLTRGSLPTGLDATLAERGYEIETPVDIQVASPASLRYGAPTVGTCVMRDTLTSAWMEVYSGGFNRDVTEIIKRIDGQVALLSFDHEGATVGVGLGVLVDGWMGIFGMQTQPALRSRGIGSAMIAGLASWAAERDTAGLYLQVEQSNPRARALYERHGFRTVYTYHYRTRF